MVSLPLIQIWNRRLLVFHLSLLNIKTRFKTTYLGFLWAALEPMLYFIVLFVVFTSIRDRPESFAIYLITGIMFYHIFVRGTSGGLVSLVGNKGIIKSLNIKKEIFPVISTVAIGILGLVDICVFFGLMPVFEFTPSWTLILLPIPLFLLLILILGLSYLLSVVNVYLRDIQNIWSIFVHSLLFVSPIFWYLKDVNNILIQIQKINPLGQLIEISHKLVIDGKIPQLTEWAYTISFVLVILFVGFFVFKKFESRTVEEL